MIKTFLVGASGLLLAAGGPIAYYSAPEYWDSVRAEWLPADRSSDVAVGAAWSEDAAANGGKPPGAVEGAAVSDLSEVLHFGATPGWIIQRWPRVSTGLSHLQLQGYRVPLVTGTAQTDLAGSLTYYFNAQQELQRITFHGATGDAQQLVRFLTTRHHFARRLTNNPGLFVFEAPHEDGERLSALRITAVGVVRANDPNRRFKVDLVMERPGEQS